MHSIYIFLVFYSLSQSMYVGPMHYDMENAYIKCVRCVLLHNREIDKISSCLIICGVHNHVGPTYSDMKYAYIECTIYDLS